jgi:hypothetical protein
LPPIPPGSYGSNSTGSKGQLLMYLTWWKLNRTDYY